MVAGVALVAQDHVRFVVLLAATLAHGTVQAAPTLLQDHLCHLEQKPGRAFFKGFKNGVKIFFNFFLIKGVYGKYLPYF